MGPVVGRALAVNMPPRNRRRTIAAHGQLRRVELRRTLGSLADNVVRPGVHLRYKRAVTRFALYINQFLQLGLPTTSAATTC